MLTKCATGRTTLSRRIRMCAHTRELILWDYRHLDLLSTMICSNRPHLLIPLECARMNVHIKSHLVNILFCTGVSFCALVQFSITLDWLRRIFFASCPIPFNPTKSIELSQAKSSTLSVTTPQSHASQPSLNPSINSHESSSSTLPTRKKKKDNPQLDPIVKLLSTGAQLSSSSYFIGIVIAWNWAYPLFFLLLFVCALTRAWNERR